MVNNNEEKLNKNNEVSLEEASLFSRSRSCRSKGIYKR